ncbi:MAG: ribosomal-protein-alanine acetyltransferase [Acidobacteria bacterium]|nr:MAG: ribosomal-protein-alanine acetyltransferase [Acidobacteriota bacterium]
MLALERDSATASHWQPDRYDKVFSEVSPRRVALLIEAEGTGGEVGVQGFLVARSVAGEWEIENIVVGEGSRRRGWGRRLLGEFIGMIRAEGGETVFLEVRESNFAARAFYQDSHFVESGRRKGYYSHPEEDAVVYRLSVA